MKTLPTLIELAGRSSARRPCARTISASMLALATLLPLAVLTACGDDDGTRTFAGDDADAGITTDVVPDTSDATVPDDGSAMPDTMVDVEQDTFVPPAPGEPAYAQLNLTPSLPVYRPEAFVIPVLIVFDSDGTPVEDAVGTFTIDPIDAGALNETNGRLTFNREGPIVITGCMEGIEAPSPLCASRQIQVDAGPPELTITSPEPGSEFTFAEVRGGIEVAGMATDSGDSAARVFVNGAKVNVADDGSFTTVVEPQWGINHIIITSSDVLQTAERRLAVDVMVAETYLDYVAEMPEGEDLALDFPNALTLQLNQRFLDNNISAVPGSEEPDYETEDLAGVLELVFRELDLSSFIPDPVVSSSQLTLRVLDVVPGTPQIDLVVTDRGMEIFVDIPELYLRTTGNATLGETYLDLNGGVYVALSGYIRMYLRQRIDEPIDVRVEFFDIAIEENGVIGDFVSPQANAVVALVGSSLNAPITNLARSLVEDQFLNELPVLLRGAFDSIDDLLADQVLPLDLGFGEPITLSVSARTETLIPSRRRNMNVTLGAALGVDRPATQESRGIALDVPYESPPSLLQNSRVQIAARLPFINGLLHAVWNGGLLDLDVTDILPDAISFLVDSVQVEGHLSPQLRASRPGESEYSLLITLGQMEILLGKSGNIDRIGAYITVGANLTVEDNAIKVDLQPEPSLDFWLIDYDGVEPIFANPADLESLILSVVWPQLAGDLADNLAIQLPRLGLDALGDIAPSLATFELSVVLDRPVLLRDGYLIIDGGLDGALATP
jgi:hypothetical protein